MHYSLSTEKLWNPKFIFSKYKTMASKAYTFDGAEFVTNNYATILDNNGVYT